MQEFLHFVRGIERAACLKNHAQAFSVWAERFNRVRKFIEFTSMPLVFSRMVKQIAVRLFHIVFRKRYMVMKFLQPPQISLGPALPKR